MPKKCSVLHLRHIHPKPMEKIIDNRNIQRPSTERVL